MGRSIVWFRQDLRVHDNEALMEAIRNADELIPVYVFDEPAHRLHPARCQFLKESVADLRDHLRACGSDLIIRAGHPVDILYDLALQTQSQWIYCNRERTRDEVIVQDQLEQKLWTIGRELRYTRGKMLYYTSDLPFPVTHCPDAFAAFRKEVEQIIAVRQPLEAPMVLPPLSPGLEPGFLPEIPGSSPSKQDNNGPHFPGGETAGLQALKTMISKGDPDGQAMDMMALSPWISMGCLSPKIVYHASFQMKSGGDQVRQNLIYRDYLRLMGKKYGDRIFYLTGIRDQPIEWKANPKALGLWQSGQTGIPIIDAAMHQLNRTGWIPDVLRRMCAHYFVRVLRLDWRLGASYFESRLIDYDPCSNWVSWQNIAGIGPDTREDRMVHYDALGKKLDPDGLYVKAWT